MLPAVPQPSPLSSDVVSLLSHHAPMIRAYLKKLLSSASEVDEVMPEIAIAAWSKFSSLEDRYAFPQWA